MDSSHEGDETMKLNNHGWGLGVMIVFLIVFVLAIILIAIQAQDYGIGERDYLAQKNGYSFIV